MAGSTRTASRDQTKVRTVAAVIRINRFKFTPSEGTRKIQVAGQDELERYRLLRLLDITDLEA